MKQLFGVLDFTKTLDNHASKFSKIESIAYEDIFDSYADQNITSGIIDSAWYKYGFWKNEPSEKRKKRMVARTVNAYTRGYIEQGLIDNNISKYNATAFYLKYYAAINEFMNEILEEILSYQSI